MTIRLEDTLPVHLKDKVAVRLLFKVISDYWNEEIETKIAELRQFRNIDNDNIEIFNSNATALGLDYSEDAPITLEEYKKLTKVINSYNANFKGLRFIDILNYMYRVKFSVIRLWAKGVKEYWEGVPESEEEKWNAFYEETDSIMANCIANGGEWYPTSHYDLMYSSVNEQIDDIPLDSIKYLVEKLAPINYVLRFISKKLIITASPNLPPSSPSATKNGSTLTIHKDSSYVKYWHDTRSHIYDKDQYEWLSLVPASSIKHNMIPEKITVDSYMAYSELTKDLMSTVNFSRNTPAMRNSFEYPADTPRFDNNGYLILEPEAYNSLYKTPLVEQKVSLLRGTYTFSCQDAIYEVTIGSKKVTVDNSSYTFNITEELGEVIVTVVTSNANAKWQLESGKTRSSFIPGGIYRGADTLIITIDTSYNTYITYENLEYNTGINLFTSKLFNIVLHAPDTLKIEISDKTIDIPIINKVVYFSIKPVLGVNYLFINNIQVIAVSSINLTSNEYIGKVSDISIVRA